LSGLAPTGLLLVKHVMYVPELTLLARAQGHLDRNLTAMIQGKGV
jgi:hypothetical protein